LDIKLDHLRTYANGSANAAKGISQGGFSLGTPMAQMPFCRLNPFSCPTPLESEKKTGLDQSIKKE